MSELGAMSSSAPCPINNSALTIDIIATNIENTLKHNETWNEVLTSLGNCKSDVERVKLLLSTQVINDLIKPEIIRREKSYDIAESMRALGNQHFKAAQYELALDCYSEAIRFAPSGTSSSSATDCSKILALCFGNRSAAYFHMKQFHCCLLDIENALHAGFPSSSLYKILDRKGKCCLFLKRKHEAVNAFEQARNALSITLSIQDKWKKDMMALIDQFIKKCLTLPDENKSEEILDDFCVHAETPVLTSNNPQIPCASDCIRLGNHKVKGRGLYATRDIKIGEVLIVEKPYTSVVLTDRSLAHCHHCCVRCFVPLPCDNCVDVVFCSQTCRQAAMDSYHRAECQIMECFHRADLRLGHLAYKMVAKAGYDYLVKEKENLEQPSQLDPVMLGCDEKGVYSSENYATMYHLIGHSDKRSAKDIWPRAVKAVFLVKCLEQTSFFPPFDNTQEALEKRKSDLIFIGSHILRHLQMLPCNAHEVSEMGVNLQEPSQSSTLEIGSAIYPVLSLINHSCDPSVVRHSYADVCVVRAIRSIAEGEELYDNYGALYPVMDYAMRQKHLSKQYFFQCLCEACIKNWPLYMDISKDIVNFYCEKCRGRVPVPDMGQVSKMESMACVDCGFRQNIRGLILKVGSLEQGYQKALHKVIFQLNVDGDTLATLVQFLRVVDKYVHRPFSSHNDCQEAIKMCYAYKANAYPRLKRVLPK